MSQIKSRNWTSQEDEDLTTIIQEMKESQKESTWNQIAEKMRLRNSSSRKTGKQCRERWANQLDPKIKRSENWTKEENETLFRFHFELGNKWSEICSHIPGRTDNCVKNHFYSTMRRGMRKINSYIENVKRKTSLAKTFKNEILNKILALCEGRNDDKFQFSSKAKNLAIKIKTDLVQLSLAFTDVDEENEKFKEQVFEEISEFSRNCRKRKTKKSSDLFSEVEEDSELKKIKINQASTKEIKKEFTNNTENYQNTLKMEKFTSKENEAMNQPIRLPLLQLTKPIGVSEQSKIEENIQSETESQTLRNFKGEQIFENFNSMNPFSFALSWQNPVNYFGIKEKNEKNEKNDQNVENGFINSIPEIKNAKGCENKAYSGFIDFTVFPSFKPVKEASIMKETVNTIFPEIIKSQELELPSSLKLKNENTSPHTSESNEPIFFSPSFSPFSFYHAHTNFTSLSTIQDEKFRSTRYDSHDFEENSPINEKTGFKLVRRPSNNENKGNECKCINN